MVAVTLFGGGPREKFEKLSGVAKPSMPSAPSSSLDLRGVVDLDGTRLAMDGVRLRVGMEGNGVDATRGLGDGGAMIPRDASLRGLGRNLGSESKDNAPKNFLNNETRPPVEIVLVGGADTASAP